MLIGSSKQPDGRFHVVVNMTQKEFDDYCAAIGRDRTICDLSYETAKEIGNDHWKEDLRDRLSIRKCEHGMDLLRMEEHPEVKA